MASQGRPTAWLVPKTLWPVPQSVIKEAAQGIDRVLVVEMNLGQYVREIERILPDRCIDFLGQMDGRLIAPDQIKEALTND
jgi:2-oxoglutarate ferredoxin oxidoreductase subunit alpha